MSMSDKKEEMPPESVTTSWIQLDQKAESENSEESGRDSDKEDMKDALAEASRSMYNGDNVKNDDQGEEKAETPSPLSIPGKVDESSKNSSGSSSSRLLYISALLLSHSVALIFGVVIGRKMICRRN